MPKRASHQLGLDLPETGRPWPKHARFPHNADGEEVGGQLIADLLDSDSPLMVAGYASVERILALAHEFHRRGESQGAARRMRVLIGVEPTLRSELRGPRSVGALEREIADYWLSQGVSTTQWRGLMTTIDLLDRGRLRVRSSGRRRIHAKIYIGESAATLGSSNFTDQGLEGNLEANVRFTHSSEPERYDQTTDFAENLWTLGDDYTAAFRQLLESLLRRVTWQEALARACGELLEGDWMRRRGAPVGVAVPLWPSQEQGVAQALWVLENVGSVLIADATGAGKTRMGAFLIRALRDRNWRTGRSPSQYPLLICPPATRRRWRTELAAVGEAADVHSHGILSRTDASERVVLDRALEQTQLLIVDEAHNFLNRLSARSRSLYGSSADHVILLTATPINRGATDLLSIVDLLGADNFDDDVLEIVTRLGGARRKSHAMTEQERNRVKGALRTFVVRRTKREFNDLIDREPERFTNALGLRCRFPKHVPVVFRRDDPASDRARALEIQECAKRLRGLVNLRRLEMPWFYRIDGWSEERFLEMRLRGATALAAYHVRSSLRSSRAALIEHLLGTGAAAARFGLSSFKAGSTGNVIATLGSYGAEPPEVRLTVPVPAWLADPEQYHAAVQAEIATYKEILTLAEGMSEFRAKANARYLVDLMGTHDRVLAFDSHLISLFELEARLTEVGAADVAVATGSGSMNARLKFADRFGLEASESKLIGLCSDALAEGINLQGASAIVHLDLPTVVRVLEQRIGRVDRMDSPHSSVEVHWPEEPAEFALRSDDRLFLRLREVEDLLGSNVPLPVSLDWRERERGDLALSDLMQQVEAGVALGADMSLADAFGPVRGLVTGSDALVPPAVYERLRLSQARVLSCVSVVSAPRPWVFVAVGAADRSVPRWLFIDLEKSGDPSVLGDLDQIAAELRTRLEGSTSELQFDASAADLLTEGLAAVVVHQRDLLPRRKQRALDELRHILTTYRGRAANDPERLALISELLSVFDARDDTTMDLGRLAEWWLATVRHRWLEYLQRPRIPRPVQLKRLRRELLANELGTAELRTIRDVKLQDTPLQRRVVAAIVGVPVSRG